MKTLALFLMLALPVMAEKRVVNNKTYDLSTKPTNWFELEGKIVQQSAYHWIVDVKIQGDRAKAPPYRVTLRNPPSTHLEEYKKIKAEYWKLWNEHKAAKANAAKNPDSNEQYEKSQAIWRRLELLDTKGHNVSKDFVVKVKAMQISKGVYDCGKPIQ